MTIADRLREEGAVRSKYREVLRIAQEVMGKGFGHEVVLTLIRLSPDNLTAPSR